MPEREWTGATYGERMELLFHRVLAQHAPFEVCDDCPQPITGRALRLIAIVGPVRGKTT